MKTLEPIYPELVEKIKAEYRLKIDAQPNEMLKKALQIKVMPKPTAGTVAKDKNSSRAAMFPSIAA